MFDEMILGERYDPYLGFEFDQPDEYDDYEDDSPDIDELDD